MPKTPQKAMKLAQFYMKDIVHKKTGEVLLELEHEIRCRFANTFGLSLQDVS